jgi:Tfp pilus assembly protein PilV
MHFTHLETWLSAVLLLVLLLGAVALSYMTQAHMTARDQRRRARTAARARNRRERGLSVRPPK